MLSLVRRPAVSAAALLLVVGTGQAAQAAVTAQQVWDDYKAGMDVSEGGNVTVGSEELAGGVLTVRDVAYNSTGEDGTVVTATLDQITLTENADGTVAVALPAEVPVTVSSPADAAAGTPATDVALAVTQTGMTLTVSGDPGALSYAQAASRIALELRSVTQGGAEVPAEGLLALNDVTGTTTSTGGDLRDMAYDVAVGSVDMLLDVTNGQDASRLTFSGQLQALALNAQGTVPLSASTSPDTALADGLAIAGGYTSGPGQYMFEFTDAAGPTSGTVATGGSTVNFDVSRASVGYDATAQGIEVNASGASMPFPVTASIAEYGLKALIPAQKSDAPAPWALGINLTDLALNEEVWALFDPQALLPRDPATLIADLSGTATPFFDLFDPAQQAAMETAPAPGEINSVSIDDLTLSFGGAQVTGTGSFTLDNADTTTFPGIPKPTGVAEFQLNGINGLLDNLVTLGLLPQEQVMGARMGLGLLTVPAGGDDQLTSRIEATADGQLLANGQRLQ